MMRLTVFRQPQQTHREVPWLLAVVWACVKSLPTVQHALDSFHTFMLLVVRPLEARAHTRAPRSLDVDLHLFAVQSDALTHTHSSCVCGFLRPKTQKLLLSFSCCSLFSEYLRATLDRLLKKSKQYHARH